MSRGRAAAFAVALILLIAFAAECSSGGSSKSTAAADRRAAAQTRAATVRARTLAAKRRAAVRARRIRLVRARRAHLAYLRNRRRNLVLTVASNSATTDIAKIQLTVNLLNLAFHASVATGITSSVTANHWVERGVYTGGECTAFETARGGGVVTEALIVHPTTLAATPGWVDPVVGQVPEGRIYQMTIDEIQTLVTTGQQRRRSFPIHVTVKSNGSARLFLRCR